MKTLITLVIAFICCCGCSSNHTPATVESVKAFHSVFFAELVRLDPKLGKIPKKLPIFNRSGNAYSATLTYRVPSAALAATNLAPFAQAARVKWGQYERFYSRGEGGQPDLYTLSFGDHHSHAFIDIYAVPESNLTRITFLLRLLE